MRSINVYHYDAFSNVPNMGNPAGVVLCGDEMTKKEMQEVALKVGFNETSFVMASPVADVKIRFFTPGHEMNLCGHGTMAAVYALRTRGLLGEKANITIDTKAGILPVMIHPAVENDFSITMKQAPPEFKAFNGSKKDLAHSIGIHESDIHPEWPILYGSTGTWTLLLPIKEIATFKKMIPNNKLFPEILKEMPKVSIHPFCLNTYNPESDMHARHFSSPFSGTVEDAVTGTASGVMGAYYAKFIHTNVKDPLNLVIEQGQEIGKDGRVEVHVCKNEETFDVSITGNAVLVKEMEVKVGAAEK